MATNIHVRAVDDDLAAAAKRRAAATHRSLSSYVRDLIAEDVNRHDSRARMRELLEEIANDNPGLDRETTAAALAEARREFDAT